MAYPLLRPDLFRADLTNTRPLYSSVVVTHTEDVYRHTAPLTPKSTPQNTAIETVDLDDNSSSETRMGRWMHNFEALKTFKNMFGHTNVTRTKAEHRALGNWVHEQRRKKRNGLLTDAQISLLESLSFDWVKRTNAPS